MQAVIKTGGKQILVSLGQRVKIEKIAGSAGDRIIFDQVLLLFDNEGKNIKIGKPYLNLQVEGKIVDQAKDKKIIIFKYKPKKRYKVKKGHRQSYTLVQIDKIGDEKLKPKAKETAQPTEKKDAQRPARAVKAKEEKKKPINQEKKSGEAFFE